MSPIAIKFIISATVIVVSTVAGYLCRRWNWVEARASERIMTFVAVAGYSSVGFLAVWGTTLHGSDAILPLWAALHAVLLTFLSLAVAGWFAEDRAEKGLFALTAGIGNNGFTGGAFVLYLLFGEEALGLANIYVMLFMGVAVLLMYPIAKHYASEVNPEPLSKLILRSLLDWRSIGLPMVLSAIVLSACKVTRPGWITNWHIVDILVYSITPLAFFGIGLRLRFSRIKPLMRMIVGLALMRFVVAALLGVALAYATWLLPWSLRDLRWNVYVIEAFVPTAITSVAVANMFNLRPDEASTLFVVNTAMYLILVLPVVFWLFG
jgi:predicted permease